jgi:hypothetical protein
MRGNSDRNLIASLFGWNDLLLSFFMCMVTVVALLITQIQTMKTDAKTEDDKSAGNISVYVFWRDGIDADIDTHLMGPNGEHVFYGRTAGHTWNLLRDDLGGAGDDEKRNFENAYSRGIPPGDYTVNVHAFRASDTFYPINVEIEVRITADPTKGKGGAVVYKNTVTLLKTGEELTALRFSIDGSKTVVPGSVNHIFRPIVQSG